MFKAALTASIGICFAQHLWFVLSGNATSLLTIEKIFSFRTNILALSHLRSIRRAPLLFLMALLVWCLGLATLYPPGALIMIFEAHTLTENYNMSVMNPSVPRIFVSQMMMSPFLHWVGASCLITVSRILMKQGLLQSSFDTRTLLR
jgi:hypothetical protein